MFALQDLSVVGFKLHLTLATNIANMPPDPCRATRALIDHLDHDFGGTPHGAGNEFDVAYRQWSPAAGSAASVADRVEKRFEFVGHVWSSYPCCQLLAFARSNLLVLTRR